MKIYYDKRVELIFGLFYSAYKERYVPENYGKYFFIESDFDYYRDFFILYQNNVSKELKEYIKQMGLDTYERTLHIALSLNENYKVIEDFYIKKIRENNKNFDANKLSFFLRQFVEKADFDNFFNEHQIFYNEQIKKFYEALNYYNKFDSKLLEEFYGFKIGKSEILLFNFVNGSFGYCKDDLTISCISVNVNYPISKRIINTCIHEFSHSYVNTLSEKYFQTISLCNLYDDAVKHGLQSCYYNKFSLINEYIVRAVQVYFSKKFMEKEYLEKTLLYHKNIGFTYIEKLENLVEQYKTNYKNFEDFYKIKIVDFFVNLNRELS